MTTLPSSTTTDDWAKGAEPERGDAQALHADSDKILQIVFRVARMGSGKRHGPLHHHYRAILWGPGRQFHLAGSHVSSSSGDNPAQNAPGSGPSLWVERRCGLRGALHAVNRFVPEHQGAGAHVTYRIHKGRKTCRALWRWMSRVSPQGE